MEEHTPQRGVHGIEGRPVRHRASKPMTRLANALRSLAIEFARWRQFRRDTHELQSLNDHILADIGLTRSEVERVARYGRRGDD
jgi:uncharacterized protein YjiS (DUF1127 family)